MGRDICVGIDKPTESMKKEKRREWDGAEISS